MRRGLLGKRGWEVLSRPLALLLAAAVIVAGCSPSGYRLANVAKSDIDLVADSHCREMEQLLQELTVKLYRRNPCELNKVPGQTARTRLTQLFGGSPLDFVELDHRQGTEAMLLCFDERFGGDRVFALMAGLVGMIRQSYNGKGEFFVLDSLDGQKLYNSARNLEILAWRLANRTRSDGRPFLLTNSLPGEEANLSFERLFGKMIAVQDMMASITADRTNRTINQVVQRMAAAVFLPVGL